MHDPNDPDALYPEGNLDFYRQEIERHESDLFNIAMQLEFSQDIHALADSPGWKKIVERMRAVVSDEIAKLKSKPMSPYELGKRQGRIAALDLVVGAEPLTEGQVSDLLDKAKLLKDRIQTLRNLA